MLLRRAPLLLLAVFAGCSSAAPVSGEAELQAELRKITTHCNVPSTILQSRGDLVVIGGKDLEKVPYDRIDCMMNELKARGLGDKLGFIGNEAYE